MPSPVTQQKPVTQQPAAEQATGGDELSLSAIPALPAALAPARSALGDFLRAHAVPEELAADAVLATYEAIANIVEHAYPAGDGTFDLHATYTRDVTLTVTITDHGTWKTSGPDPASRRGRGLQLMRSCSDDADIATTDDGTQVHLQWSCSRSATPDDEQAG